MIKNIISVSTALILSTGFANAQSCADAMIQNMRQMAQNALRCGESADLISSIQSGSGRISYDVLAQACQTRVDVSGQLAAFNQCSRVYVCATLAYQYALSNLSRFGGNCTAAANAGLQRYPVQ